MSREILSPPYLQDFKSILAHWKILNIILKVLKSRVSYYFIIRYRSDSSNDKQNGKPKKVEQLEKCLILYTINRTGKPKSGESTEIKDITHSLYIVSYVSYR